MRARRTRRNHLAAALIVGAIALPLFAEAATESEVNSERGTAPDASVELPMRAR